MRVARPHPVLLCLLLCILPWARPPRAARAEERYVPPDYLQRPPVLPERLRERRPRQLAISEAIETALRRNLGIALSREQVREVAAGRAAALADFEPTLRLSGGYTASASPPTTLQEGEPGQVFPSSRVLWGLRLQERLPTGTTLSLDFDNQRQDSGLQNAVSPLLYRSTLTLSVVQPVLRDFSFGGRVLWAQVLRADFASARALQEARLRALLTVKLTEDAYWGLAESWRRYEVARGAMELAERQMALTRRQIQAGITAESELIGAQGTVAQRQVGLIAAEADIERAADVMRQLLNMPDEDWDRPLLPADAPDFTPVASTFPDAWERALAARPELAQVDLDVRRVALDLEVAYNARLPWLNLLGSASLVGQDATLLAPDGVTVQREAEYPRALAQVRAAAGWQASAGVELSWAPIGVGARAEIRRLRAALRQRGIGRAQWQSEIRVQLRAALRAIDTAERQLYATARSRELAERNLDVEQRRFLNGLTSNYIVAQRQGDLLAAQLQEVQALIQHKKAGSELLLATGELLEARRLRFDVRAAP